MSWLFGIDTAIDALGSAITGGSSGICDDPPASSSSNHSSPEYNIWGQPTNDAARDEVYRAERAEAEASKSWWD